MKDYFKFNLTGKKLLPIWLLYLLLFAIPYGYIQFKIQGIQNHQPLQPSESLQLFATISRLYAVMFILIIVRYAINFFIAKMSINNSEFKQENFLFEGKFWEFIGIIILGFLLSLITFGIYSPWFAKNVCNFVARNTTYKLNNFEFKGKGSDLFLIITFALILPIMIIIGVMVLYASIHNLKSLIGMDVTPTPEQAVIPFIMLIAIFVIMIPYFFYITKWILNIQYKNYTIQLEASFWDACGKLIIEILLSIITIGIYSPLASLKMYQYFAEKTVAVSDANSKKFGYDINSGMDFLFIWGQILLTIITIGVYYPWAYSKIGSRILGKTYTEKIEVAE